MSLPVAHLFGSARETVLSLPAPPYWHAVADLLLVLVVLALAVILWFRRSRAGMTRATFASLAAFAACGAAVYVLAVLADGSAGSQILGFAKIALAALGWVAVVTLFRCRPPAAASDPDARKEELTQLRLLGSAVSACGDGVVIAEAVGEPGSRLRIVYSNPAFERMTGYSSDEAVGLSPSVLADDVEVDSLAAVRDALRGTQPVRVEVCGRRKDGGRLWTEWQVVPVADEVGRFTHAVAVLRDTTERRMAEQAVRESEARFRGLFEQAADAIFLLDSNGRIVDANPCACNCLGYSREELTALPLVDLVATSPVRHGGSADTVTSENRYRRKDGTEFPVEVRVGSAQGGGRVAEILIVRDVSRRRAAEVALRKSEAMLRLVWTSAADGMRLADAAGTVVMANPTYCRMVGLTPSEVVGRSLADAYAPDRRGEILEKHRGRFVARSAPPPFESEVSLADGRRRWFEVTSALLDLPGEEPLLLGVFRDVTDRKRLEEQFRQAQKMEAVGRLAGGVAHDFNNLLTVILGNTDLIARLPHKSPGAPGLIDDIRGAADRAAGLVRQLLTFSRRQPVRPEVLDLREVVSGLAGLLRRLLGERVVVVTRPAADPVRVRADRGQLEQVVMNLAVNAKDAMPDGGTLTISAERVPTSDSEEGVALARLCVSDTGVGMTEEVKARIFEPFFTTKGPDKGTGLGLATVFGIVQQAGGRIAVESEVGRGTTFRIDFPECAAGLSSTAISARDSTVRIAPGRGRSVLLVEDEDGVRNLARFVLEGHGYAVSEAPDGEAALGLLDPGREFDVLVTDLTMPGIGGRELAGRVRARQPGVGVVFVSGYTPDADRFGDLPGAVFLPKPFTPADLLRATGKALAHPDGRSPVKRVGAA
jgi:two-component system cell cycle sensor histidine kinase/response regulator CckA